MIELAPIFSDNTVFAEGKPIRVFGRGDRARVSFLGETVDAGSENGFWLAELSAREAGGPYEMDICSGGERITLKNVFVGRTYLVAGQSNAEFTLEESNTPESLYNDDVELSCFFTSRPWSENEPMRMSDGWQTAKKNGVGKWSAIGYLAGKYIRSRTDAPVGIISCFQGASVIESWLPPLEAAHFRLTDDKLYYDHYCKEFEYFNRNSVICEQMLKTLFPFSLSGVIWYQGESDASPDEAAIYARELSAFFAFLREGFRDAGLPVALVQIADCDERLLNNGEGWIGIQNAQRVAAEADPLVRLVVSRDISETGFIHPPTKTLLALRIAKALLGFEAGK